MINREQLTQISHEAARTGTDLYLAVAAEMYKVPRDQVTQQMREVAKAHCHSFIYGATTAGGRVSP